MQWAINRIEVGEVEKGIAILEKLAGQISAYRKYTYYYTIIASTIIYYFYVYNENQYIADQLFENSKIAQYGSEKNITEFQLCLLARRHCCDTWLKEFRECERTVIKCQNMGLKCLYLKQLNYLSKQREEKLLNIKD